MNASLRIELAEGKVLRIMHDEGKFVTNLYIPRKEDQELIPGGDSTFHRPEEVLKAFGSQMNPDDIIKFRNQFKA